VVRPLDDFDTCEIISVGVDRAGPGPYGSSVASPVTITRLRAGQSTEGLAVETDGLTKVFGGRTVVDDVALAIPRGAVCGFIGPNGAGKTTTIRMLLGLVRPTSGGGSVLGSEISEPATYLDKVGALIESPAFYPQLSGQGNLLALCDLGRIPRERAFRALARVGLAERGGDGFRTYSLGMKQRLGIAAALLPNPELLVLDEPTNGLDPAGIVETRGLIRSFADDGITVIVSSHLIAEIEQICDFVVVIRAGRLVHQGPIAELHDAERRDVHIAPERDEDRNRLRLVLEDAGEHLSVHPSVANGTLVVLGSTATAAELNRLAADQGITLRHLAETEISLERVFFALTGEQSHDVPVDAEMGTIQ
jgi:ABC-2 type transport system ATP-binding protein